MTANLPAMLPEYEPPTHPQLNSRILAALRQADTSLLAFTDAELMERLAVWRNRLKIIGRISPPMDRQ